MKPHIISFCTAFAVAVVCGQEVYLPKFKAYVQAVILAHREDNCVLWWDIYNEPGKGNDQMKGYYVGFSVDALCLGKMNNNWQELATFDLKKRPCKVDPDVWNRLRVSLKGNQIQVWFNPLHDDPVLRITYTDARAPILKGCIGVRASGVQAWVDDLVVLP